MTHLIMVSDTFPFIVASYVDLCIMCILSVKQNNVMGLGYILQVFQNKTSKVVAWQSDNNSWIF